MARPTKEAAILIEKRNKDIMSMKQKGYPREYIAGYFNISKSRLSRIITSEENNYGK